MSDVWIPADFVCAMCKCWHDSDDRWNVAGKHTGHLPMFPSEGRIRAAELAGHPIYVPGKWVASAEQ